MSGIKTHKVKQKKYKAYEWESLAILYDAKSGTLYGYNLFPSEALLRGLNTSIVTFLKSMSLPRMTWSVRKEPSETSLQTKFKQLKKHLKGNGQYYDRSINQHKQRGGDRGGTGSKGTPRKHNTKRG